MNIFDFTLGYTLGQTKANRVIPAPIEEIQKNTIPEEKVYKYVRIHSLDNIDAELGESYDLYRDKKLITLCKDGELMYYLEVLVNKSEMRWGNEYLEEQI